MTPAEDTLRLDAFTTEHIDDAARLSRQVAWPHRAEDWALTLSQSRGVVAIAGDAVVGTALVSVFGDVALLSMIIVDETQRGKRIGRRLMEAIIAMAEGQQMRLVATRDGLPLYEKLGFRATGDIRQHQGIAVAAEPEIPVSQGAGDPAMLAAMDVAASGLRRDGLLARLCAQGTVFGCDGGFAIMRDFGRGKVLGPIVATDLPRARALLAAAAQNHAGEFLRIDTPCAELGQYAETLGLAHAGGGTAMSVGGAARNEDRGYRTYGLVSQALG
ncbi:GNAT family N-acetyltransferase [Microbulbifer sp. S227A]|uniref:GNAT family N-acetyltransferase n=1 Tax=Microbulbifer sp. S227A TaxID=3415131 RepID=UPI003C7B8789